MTTPSGSETFIQVVLSVSPNDEDCGSLERILKRKQQRRSVTEAEQMTAIGT